MSKNGRNCCKEYLEGPPAQAVKAHFGTRCEWPLKGNSQCPSASQRSAERTAPSISAVGTRDIITPVGVGKVAIRTAAPCVDSLRVKVVRSDPGELSLNNWCPQRIPDPAGCPGLPARLAAGTRDSSLHGS